MRKLTSISINCCRKKTKHAQNLEIGLVFRSKFRWRSILMLVACLGGFIIPVLASAPDVSVLVTRQAAQPSVKQLEQLARSIAVKIRSKDVLGSGILIRKQGNVYTVVTNEHVLLGGDPPYRIE